MTNVIQFGTNGITLEHDLYQDCLERINRKIEADGEEALALALKEHGFEKVVRCSDCRFSFAHGNGCARNQDQDIFDSEPEGFCAWGGEDGNHERVHHRHGQFIVSINERPAVRRRVSVARTNRAVQGLRT